MRKTILFFLLLFASRVFSVEYIPPRYELEVHPDGNSNSFSLRINLKCFVNASSTRIFVYIPDGIEILSGDKEKVIELDSGDVYEDILSMRFLSNGRYVISVKAHYLGEGSIYRDMEIEYLYVLKTDTSFTYGFSVPSGFYDTLDFAIKDTALVFLSGDYHVVISGYVSYYDEDKESRIPFPHARVCLVNEAGQVVAFVWSNASGRYTIDTYLPPGIYTICVVAKNEAAWIGGEFFEGPRVFSPQYRIEAANMNIVKNFDIPAGEQSCWVRILRSMYKAWKWSNENFGYARSCIKVNYYSEGNKAYYAPIFDYIVIEGSNKVWGAVGRYVCTHEYGHGLMYEKIGPIEAFGPSPHYYYTVSNLEFAFVEGWAEFFGMAVWSDKPSYYGKGWVERYIPYPYSSSYWRYPYWKGEDGTNEDGRIVEGAVMSFLWDLFDGPQTNDGGSADFDDDGIWNKAWEIGQVIDKLKIDIFFHVDITDFKAKWDELGYPNCNEIYNINLNINGGSEGNKPPSPVLLSVSLSESPTGILLHWSDSAVNEGGFIIERKRGTGNFTKIDTIKMPNATSYIDISVWNEQTYTYRILTITADTSVPSNEITISTPPWDFHVLWIAENGVELGWNEFFGNEIGFQIARQRVGETYWDYLYAPPNTESFIDNTMERGGTYRYKIRGILPGNSYSDWSPEILVTVPGLNSPTNFTATPTSYHSISLTWRDNSQYNTGYEIEYKVENGSWQHLVSLGDVESYPVDNLSPSTKYRFRLWAVDDAGHCSDTVYASAITLPYLSSRDISALSGNNSPSFRVSPDGRLGIVYLTLRDGKYSLWYQESDDGGNTWSDAVKIAEPALPLVNPGLGIRDDGRITVVWKRDTLYLHEAWSFDGQEWERSQFTNTGEWVCSPGIWKNRVVWVFRTEEPYNYYCLAINDTIYENRIGRCLHPSFAYDRVLMESKERLCLYSISERLFEFISPGRYPVLDWENGRYYGAFVHGDTVFGISMKGNVWESKVMLGKIRVPSGVPESLYTPSVAGIDSEHGVVIWSSRDTLYCAMRLSSSSWTFPGVIEKGIHYFSPQVATDGDNLYVIWIEDGVAPYRIRFNKIDLSPSVSVLSPSLYDHNCRHWRIGYPLRISWEVYKSIAP
ncbi:hypothetical protein DRQ18_05080, partial [bacterium]